MSNTKQRNIKTCKQCDRVIMTTAGKERLAIALIMLKDYEGGVSDQVTAMREAMRMADGLGVRPEFDRLLSKLPPFQITEKLT